MNINEVEKKIICNPWVINLRAKHHDKVPGTTKIHYKIAFQWSLNGLHYIEFS